MKRIDSFPLVLKQFHTNFTLLNDSLNPTLVRYAQRIIKPKLSSIISRYVSLQVMQAIIPVGGDSNRQGKNCNPVPARSLNRHILFINKICKL